MATLQTVRRWIMTGAVAAITITGTIYGAGLKGQQEIKQQKRQVLQATPEERIAQLEVTRADLVLKKNEMERKIAMIGEKRRVKEQGQADGR
ncbi:hypothetical protein COCC4DRAFT_137550 [Bipolaris maydis ATCC 48331]|uniref:Uncharacterized protein n=2 Tax=Cochliobolus heterostrophus TaxID=5016 RepID=M2SUB0_COCH5|nr:uncharacterized protein COCC4DRAFT_137550 [Bipolaris maydis ATCC 48331]EMD88925.1 hypothetical protein COCHEDRAFT_1109759 [Bipolaris maydis C5]KAJ5028511.1 hypothetical protein J3E73DRAFT_290036 [Bipolaris maydis]ENI05359.1 hypothetical protein COCC4DRAFT_137550 [Bipolaris maydis ATCC 48331]KAJ5063288.1 hypothetical protein J3E74DRAFT_317038 [Bipolaris maydis]KAJ6199553.1 hypothetical protein J3E72DRAFT_304097 [Bipolaris maydis]